jgi:hypothetical protein
MFSTLVVETLIVATNEVTLEIKFDITETGDPGEGRGGIASTVGVTTIVWGGDLVGVGVRVMDGFVDINAETARVGVAVPELDGVGVDDGEIDAVPVPVTLPVFDKDEVMEGEEPIEILAVGVGVCDPVIVFDADEVPEGVFVDELVPDIVSEPLIVSDGVKEEVVDALPDSDIDAPNENVVVVDCVAELLRLVDVEGVGNGVIVGLTVPELVAVVEEVCVTDDEVVDSALGVIEGEAPDERLAVGEAVIEPDIVEEPLGVPDGEFEGDGVPVGVMLKLNVDEGLFPADGETVPDWEAESPAERVVVGELVGEVLILIVVEEVCELVPDWVWVSEPVPEPVGVCVLDAVPEDDGVGVGVIDELAIDVLVDCNDAVEKSEGFTDDDGSDVYLALRVLRRPVDDAIDDGEETLVPDNDIILLADILGIAEVDFEADALEDKLSGPVACAVPVNIPVINEVDVIKTETDEIVVTETTLDTVDTIEMTGVFVWVIIDDAVICEDTVLEYELIAVTVTKVEAVGIGKEDAVTENWPLDETIILDNAESDKMAEIVYNDDSVFIADEETVILLENDDTELPVDVALVEEEIKDVSDIVITALVLDDATWDFEIFGDAVAEGSAVIIPVVDAQDDALEETIELRDCKALTETAALSDSTTADGKDDGLCVAIAVLEVNDEEV